MDNRLRQVTLPGGTTNLCDYDANGLRIRKNDSTGTTGFLLDGPSVLEELSSTENTATSYLTNPQVIDEIDSFQQNGATFYPLTDALGSIYAVTNPSGSLVSSYNYEVYGARTQSSGTLALNFGYTGREHDADAGQIYQRDRPRDPRTGAWLQPDRLASATFGTNVAVDAARQIPALAWQFTAKVGAGVNRVLERPNAYQYARNAPTLFADSTGFVECAENWAGVPVFFIDAGIPRASVVLFGGIYSGLSTGSSIWVLTLYAEFGIFGGKLPPGHPLLPIKMETIFENRGVSIADRAIVWGRRRGNDDLPPRQGERSATAEPRLFIHSPRESLLQS